MFTTTLATSQFSCLRGSWRTDCFALMNIAISCGCSTCLSFSNALEFSTPLTRKFLGNVVWRPSLVRQLEVSVLLVKCGLKSFPKFEDHRTYFGVTVLRPTSCSSFWRAAPSYTLRDDLSFVAIKIQARFSAETTLLSLIFEGCTERTAMLSNPKPRKIFSFVARKAAVENWRCQDNFTDGEEIRLTQIKHFALLAAAVGWGERHRLLYRPAIRLPPRDAKQVNAWCEEPT